MWQYNYSNELTHYGVLGMKWGVRRYQNKDGSLTKAGKSRYNDEVAKAKINLATAKSAYKQSVEKFNKTTFDGLFYDEKAIKMLDKAHKKLRYAKEDLSDAKAKFKMENQSDKSKRQQNFEQKYKEKGMTQEEAAIAAYKRVRTERIIAVTAGITVAAATAYVAYKYYDNSVDKIIKPGTLLQNISTNSNKGVSDAFYASMNGMDNIKYRGIYGDTLRAKGANSVFETKIKVDNGLKLASRKNATQILNDLVKSDNDFTKNLENSLKEMSYGKISSKQKAIITEGIQSLNSGKIDSKVYDALNIGLANHSLKGQTVSDAFYDKLKSKGYDAIKDINDSKYSGYMSRNPIIVFNGQSKTSVGAIRELGEREILKNRNLATMELFGREYAKIGAPYAASLLAAVGATTATVKTVKSKSDAKIVSEYRKKHPDTTLSYKEIVRNYEKGRKT